MFLLINFLVRIWKRRKAAAANPTSTVDEHREI